MYRIIEKKEHRNASLSDYETKTNWHSYMKQTS